jgi:hypothetical protein
VFIVVVVVELLQRLRHKHQCNGIGQVDGAAALISIGLLVSPSANLVNRNFSYHYRRPTNVLLHVIEDTSFGCHWQQEFSD